MSELPVTDTILKISQEMVFYQLLKEFTSTVVHSMHAQVSFTQLVAANCSWNNLFHHSVTLTCKQCRNFI